MSRGTLVEPPTVPRVPLECPNWCQRTHGRDDDTDGLHLTVAEPATIHDTRLSSVGGCEVWLVREQLHPSWGRLARADFLHLVSDGHCDSLTVDELREQLHDARDRLGEAVDRLRLLETAATQLVRVTAVHRGGRSEGGGTA